MKRLLSIKRLPLISAAIILFISSIIAGCSDFINNDDIDSPTLVPIPPDPLNGFVLYAETTDKVDTDLWDVKASEQNGGEIFLTKMNEFYVYGRLLYKTPIDFSKSDSIKVEFDYAIYGGGYADGLIFSILDAANYEDIGVGYGLGLPLNNFGLKVIFDTYDNNSLRPNPELQVQYGSSYSEDLSVPDQMLGEYIPNDFLRTKDKRTCQVIWYKSEGKISVTLLDPITKDVVLKVFDKEVVPIPEGARLLNEGYFALTAATGFMDDNHVVENFKIYLSKGE